MLKRLTALAVTTAAFVSLITALGTTEPGARVLEDLHAAFEPSGALETAERVPYPSLVTAAEYMDSKERVERMMTTDLDPRLRVSPTLVIADLSPWGAGGLVDFRVSPNTLYIAPGTASGEEDGLLWVLTHEAAHVRQFATYDIAGTTWLDQQRMARLMADAHEVLPQARTAHEAVEMLADCMTLSALEGEVSAVGNTAYLEDPSVCTEPVVADAVDSLLDGDRLSAWGW